jgi:hypothetical protein
MGVSAYMKPLYIMTLEVAALVGTAEESHHEGAQPNTELF